MLLFNARSYGSQDGYRKRAETVVAVDNGSQAVVLLDRRSQRWTFYNFLL